MGFIERLDSSVDRLGQRFARLLDDGGQQPSARQSFGDLIPSAPRQSFGQMLPGASAGPDWGAATGQQAGGGSLIARYLGQGGGNAKPFNLSGYDMYQQATADRKAREAAAPQPGPAPSAAPTSGGAGAGLDPGIAKWDAQAKTTFGDLTDPDTMLAIMKNESGGNPDAYNAAGNAWGLFQQVGLGSNDPATQFAAARTLLQQKLAAIRATYAANGLNPDERTRARDIALAWAGHFDYQSGGPSATSRDIGSGQTADQLGAIFLKNYDAIKAARKAPAPSATGTGTGMASIWGGGNASVTQEYGAVTPGIDQNIYGYGAAYGLPQGHTGLDIGVKRGTTLYMPAGLTGTVTTAGGTQYFRDEDYGDAGTPGKGELRITLSNGDILILGHTSQIGVKAGQQVTGGMALGLSGSASGDHLHLEVRQRQADGSFRLVDPRAYFGAGAGGTQTRS